MTKTGTTSGSRADGADDSPEIGSRKKRSAGIQGVLASLKHATRAGLSRTLPALVRLNQPDGFDCPGCAWPESDKPHRAEFCENGAKAVAEEATRDRITREFFAVNPVGDLAGKSGYWLGRQGRLTEPMHLAEGDDHYRPIGWDDAFELIAARLNALGDPGQATFYTSGRTSNEAAFLYQLFARTFGTNNLPDCSNMCHESSGNALIETIGTGKGSVSLEDIKHASLLLIVGQNPGTNHPRMLTALEEAKRNGARIITINPLPEAGMKRFKNPQRVAGVLGRGTELTDLFLQVRVNGDLALFQALSRTIIEAAEAGPGGIDGAEFIDSEFIRTKTDGFEALKSHLDGLDRDQVVAATGLEGEQIGDAARMIMEADSVIACWAMGLTQHKNSVATIREIVNCLMLGGHIGRPGAGVCPVRGHSNVQGDRTMGIHENPSSEFLDALADPDVDLRPLVVHQQDIQAVVNAMWAGGATAVTIQGQRVVTTTGIKCEGSAVQLPGQVYPSPYTIQAIGDAAELTTSLDLNSYIRGYREDAAQPDIAVGWDFKAEDDIDAPAYDGLLDITSAKPLP